MTELSIPLSPLIVQVGASWCQPCKRIRPLAEKAAAELDVLFEYVSIEDNPELSEEYGIESLPTFLVFDHGRLSGSVTGSLPSSQLAARFAALLDG